MRDRKSEAIAIRINEETYERLRSLQPHLSEPARDATMSDVCRKLLMRGLRAVDEEGPDILLEVIDCPEPAAVGTDSEEPT